LAIDDGVAVMQGPDIENLVDHRAELGNVAGDSERCDENRAAPSELLTSRRVPERFVSCTV
jgi:hypothetical protein